MTDRINRLVVFLETDTRVDDVQALIDAIRQLRGVAAVEMNVADPTAYDARLRAALAVHSELVQVADRLIKPGGAYPWTVRATP